MMLGSTRLVKVYAYDAPCDMRKSFDTLSAIVVNSMKRELLSGEMFLFVGGRDRKRAKVLYWDGTGLCLLSKRLEQGRFMAPWSNNTNGSICMTVSELALFLEGSRLEGRLPLSPEAFAPRPLE
jgi:transposase